MKKISLFCALALVSSTAFALDKAGCESLKDVEILHNEMIDAVWERRRHRRGSAWDVAWKGRSTKEHAGTKQELCWQGISSVCIQRWLHTWAVTRVRQVALFVNKFRWKFDTSKILQICFCVYNVSFYGVFYVICADVSKPWFCWWFCENLANCLCKSLCSGVSCAFASFAVCCKDHAKFM